MIPQRRYLLRALYEWIVDCGEVPYVLVDANIDGVVVPQEHVESGQIVLNIGPRAVRDLNIADDYVMCQSRFGGRAFELCLPMAAIRAIYCKDSGQGMVFPEEDFAITEEAVTDESASSGPFSGEVSGDVSVPTSHQPETAASAQKPHLKLV